MALNKCSKTMAKKRYSIRDNALNKSIINSGIDIITGKKKEENVYLEIKEIEKQKISNSFIQEAIKFIMTADAISSKAIYDYLRNPSFDGCEIKELEKGFKIVNTSINQSKQRNKIWFDLEKIVGEYNKKDNFDAYILGVYYGLRAYSAEHILVLNKLFPLLKELEYTNYDTFLNYCKDLHFTKEIDGEVFVDEDKYQKGLNDKLFKTRLLEE